MALVPDPRNVTPLMDDPTNRLFFAINHYISTGDHIGEGVAVDVPDETPRMVSLMIPMKPGEPVDVHGWDALRARLDQLAERDGTPEWVIGYRGEVDSKFGMIEVWSLTLRYSDVQTLAELLMAEPGPLGWGACKATIDAHNWKLE